MFPCHRCNEVKKTEAALKLHLNAKARCDLKPCEICGYYNKK